MKAAVLTLARRRRSRASSTRRASSESWRVWSHERVS